MHRPAQRVVEIPPCREREVQGVMLHNYGPGPLWVRVGLRSFKVSRRKPAPYGIRKL
jgi:hypothetical protein